MKKHIFSLFPYVMFLFFLIVSSIIAYDLWRWNYAEWHKPYQEHWQFPRRLASMPDMKYIKEQIIQYKKILEINPENPIHWQDMGHWCWLLSEIATQEKSSILAYTETSLITAIQKMPAHGRPYFLLGKVYARQSKWEEADKAMATAQILCPNKKEFACDIAEYWAKRYLKNSDSLYLSLLTDRLLFLNQISFPRYQETTLSLWYALVPGICPWGKIIPKKDWYALETAYFFWKKKNLIFAKQYLSYIQGADYISSKSFLEAQIALQEKKVEPSLLLFEKAIMTAVTEKKDSLALQSAQMLVKSGFIKQSLHLLNRTMANPLPHRLSILSSLIEDRLYSQALPILEATKQECKPPYSPLLDFLLSQCYWSAKEISKAITHAENAFLQDYSNEKYANHLFQLLFAVNMEEKVSYYLEKYGTRFSKPSYFYHKLACHYGSKKKIDSAWYWIQKAYQLEPNKPEIQDKMKEIKALRNK